VLDFLKGMTVQELTPAGLREVGPIAIELARLEGLEGHAAAVELRLRANPP
jgi:histidinol dehydrogenase